MRLFIENSIEEITTLLKCGEIRLEDMIDECVSLSERYCKYKFWKSFDTEILKSQYQDLYSIKDKWEDKKLLGIPIGVKDVFNTRDLPTQMGSMIWEGFEAGNDARVVGNLLYNGGVMAGKTVTAEFAVHALNETLNPYNIERTPGTSSSGSAAAVALGVVPAALATQTAGSIIRPASFCGVYGYKPSFGTVPRTGVLKTTDSLDSIGFITSNIDNIRPIFDAISVHGLDYPYVYEAVSDPRRKHRGGKWRIAFVKTYIWDQAEQYVQEAIMDFIMMLKQDQEFDMKEVNIDNIIHDSHKIHETIYDKSLAYYFKNERLEKDKVSDVMNQMIEHGEMIEIEEYMNALALQTEKCCQMDLFLQNYDVILSISTSSAAVKRGQKELDDPSLIWNLLHLCSVSVPLFSHEGLPFGIQISARQYSDYLLMDFLAELCKKGYIPRHTNTKVGEEREA
ncbi:MAG: amidase [Lachnospiraceae bacterium]|nr:amidase [Lachnospiraceae bacterium]